MFVRLAHAAVNEHVASVVFHPKVSAALCEHGHRVAECGFSVVSEVLVFSDSHTFHGAGVASLLNDGWEHHIRNVACSLVGPCAYDAVNVNVH